MLEVFNIHIIQSYPATYSPIGPFTTNNSCFMTTISQYHDWNVFSDHPVFYGSV